MLDSRPITRPSAFWQRGQSIPIVADACHAPGATYMGCRVGTLADITCFSFHPVKHLTTCEGGMTLTQNAEYSAHMRRFRNHGISTDHRQREAEGTFAYDMVELGYNYRLPDVQCALGLAQLSRLAQWVEKRQTVASWYAEALEGVAHVRPLRLHGDRTHAYHLYVIRLDLAQLRVGRAAAFAHLKAQGIGANVHYGPVYRHSFYRERLC